MVAQLVRLKLALLRNLFRRSRAQTIGIVAGLIYFSFPVVGAALLLGLLRTSLADARIVIPLVGAATVVLWTVLLPLRLLLNVLLLPLLLLKAVL